MIHKKSPFSTIAVIFMAISILQMCFTSCRNELTMLNDDLEQTSNINASAKTFYSNLADIIKASTIQNPQTKVIEKEAEKLTAEFYLEHEDEYPMQAKLATIDIELEDGQIVTYFDLPEDQQIQFVDEYTEYQARLLSNKIEEIPPLEEYVMEQNRIVDSVLTEEGVITKSGDIEIKDSRAFLSILSSRLNDMAVNFEYSDSIEAETKSITWTFNSDYSVPYERAKSLMAGVAKRGDVIVALPCHEYPMSLIDFGNKKYMVGHAEIFTENITNNTAKTQKVTIGAWTEEGVSRQPFNNWCYRSYLVGLCNYKIKWRWRGFKSGFYPVKTPVSNPALLANWAEKYEGHEYVKCYEFLTPKWAAPSRFTCTSLVWWCAKKAYGVKISPWYSTLVTPSDVLCDNNTYLKVEIK